MPKLNDLTGKRFDRLLIAAHAGKRGSQHMWLCQCDCGNETVVYGCNVVSGKVKSCGCLHREKMVSMMKTHGCEPWPLYNIWSSMKARCTNPNVKRYKIYGGRGIRVCGEWATFETFRDWSLANGYAQGLSIDRIDNDGNYEPSNCRWATPVEQARNMRSNRPVIRSDGTRFPSIAEAADISNCGANAIWNVCHGLSKRAGGFGWRYGIERQVAA